MPAKLTKTLSAPAKPVPRLWTDFGTERLKAFSDGVFSIVITLLVLELKVPHLDAPEDWEELVWALSSLWPKLLAYVASFVVVGIYWLAHHNAFRYISRTKRPLLWINNFYLMSVSLIAFSAAMLGEYPNNKLASMLYGLNLVLVGLCLLGLWHYATANGLVDDHHHPKVLRATKLLSVVPVVLYSLATLLSLVSVKLALLMYVLVPTLYVMPGLLERFLEAAAKRAEAER